MGNLKSLLAYQNAFSLAMEVFKLSKKFPKKETYSLTDQVRRSSRSVCSNLAEGYRKRRYPKHFISKLSDSDSENTETQVWLDFALHCGYISEIERDLLHNKSEEVGRLLGTMIRNPEKFT